MIEIEIFVPLADNDGQRFGRDHHAEFLGLAERLCGGYSDYGIVRGAYVEGGRTYRDYNRRVAVVIPSITCGQVVRHLVGFALDHYRQLGIFVRVLGHTEVVTKASLEVAHPAGASVHSVLAHLNKK